MVRLCYFSLGTGSVHLQNFWLNNNSVNFSKLGYFFTKLILFKSKSKCDNCWILTLKLLRWLDSVLLSKPLFLILFLSRIFVNFPCFPTYLTFLERLLSDFITITMPSQELFSRSCKKVYILQKIEEIWLVCHFLPFIKFSSLSNSNFCLGSKNRLRSCFKKRVLDNFLKICRFVKKLYY